MIHLLPREVGRGVTNSNSISNMFDLGLLCKQIALDIPIKR